MLDDIAKDKAVTVNREPLPGHIHESVTPHTGPSVSRQVVRQLGCKMLTQGPQAKRQPWLAFLTAGGFGLRCFRQAGSPVADFSICPNVFKALGAPVACHPHLPFGDPPYPVWSIRDIWHQNLHDEPNQNKGPAQKPE